MCGDIPSDAEALLGFNWRINESFVRNPKAGKIHPFIIGLHCCEKKISKEFCFLLTVDDKQIVYKKRRNFRSFTFVH